MADQALHLVADVTKTAVRAADDGAPLNMGAGHSLGLLLKLASLTTGSVVAKYNQLANLGWELIFVALGFNYLRFNICLDGVVNSFNFGPGALGAGQLIVGTEYRATVTHEFSGGNHHLICSCVAADGDTPFVAPPVGGAGVTNSAAKPLLVGKREDDTFALDGTVRELAIWSVVLPSVDTAGLAGSVPVAATRLPAGLEGYWTLSGDGLDYRDGQGAGNRPLTLNGGVGFAAAAPAVFGRPPMGAAALVLQSAALVAGRVVLTFDRAALDSSIARDATRYAITPPGGKPAVAVTDAQILGSTVSLGISGDVRRGGAYSVAIALAGTVRSSADGGGNAAASNANFDIAAVAFKLSGATPLPPYPSTTLRVVFSRAAKQTNPAQADDALKSANYVITWAGGTLAVASAATVSADTVDLTTAADLPGVPYSVTPSNIKSVDGDVIT